MIATLIDQRLALSNRSHLKGVLSCTDAQT
jgi:hypothetical protein